MDFGLPHMSGLDVTKALRERGVATPIVALTAYFEQSDVDAYREARMNGFVSKPVSDNTL
jgi:CheY-like chemotaxis protein